VLCDKFLWQVIEVEIVWTVEQHVCVAHVWSGYWFAQV